MPVFILLLGRPTMFSAGDRSTPFRGPSTSFKTVPVHKK
jgi:hypothetical protein